MLVLTIENELSLAGGNVAFGLVTRLRITVRELGAPTSRTIGSAQVALIQCAHARRQGVPIYRVLEEDSSELLALYPMLFARGGVLKKQYGSAHRKDVIYVEALELNPEWRGRNIEEAIMLKVFELWGGECAVAVVDMPTLPDPARWRAAGFQLVETSQMPFLVLDFACLQPYAVEVDGQPNTFRIKHPEDLLEDDDEEDEDDEADEDDGDKVGGNFASEDDDDDDPDENDQDEDEHAPSSRRLTH